jgi:hypothetical protein
MTGSSDARGLGAPDTRASWRVGALVASLCLLPAAIRAVYYPGYPGSDDSFIHLAVLQNLVAGGGWGVNPGDPVNLSTSPLFTLALLPVAFFSEQPLVWGQALSMLAVAATIALSFAVARDLGGDARAGLLAAALAAGNIHLWRWTGSFLETTFACALVLGIVRFALRPATPGERAFSQSFSHAFGLGALIGLGALLRPEAGLLGVAWLAHALWNRESQLLGRGAAALLGLAVVLGPYALWAQATFGSVLPTAFAAKTEGGLQSGVTRTLVQMLLVLGTGSTGALLLLAAAGIAVSGDAAARRRLANGLRRNALLWGLPLAVAAFYYAKTAALQSAARYLIPFLGTLPILAAVIWWRCVGTRLRGLAVAAVAAQLVGALLLNHRVVAPVLQRMQSEYVATMSAAATELDRRCRPGDAVLVWMDLGVVSWRRAGACRIADGGRLASPELTGLDLSGMLDHTGARFVLQSLGARGAGLRLRERDAALVWSREFLSHSVGQPGEVFVARLYELPAAQAATSAAVSVRSPAIR